MPAKVQILTELGQEELLLPVLVNRALAANDRAKYLLTLLQACRQQAETPTAAAPDLRTERLACGVEDARYDSVVGGTHRLAAGVYAIPQATHVHRALAEAVSAMIAPLREAGAPEQSGKAEMLARRDALLARLGQPADSQVTSEYLDRLTSADRSAGDSVHLLVMDLHLMLNTLQAGIAQESVEGASAYGLRDADRRPVAAFMAGLHRTEGLKFDHPGLGTTATRVGGRLTIQNDIGDTDAHVLVVHVAGQDATVTYTDVHTERVAFFQRMLRPFPLTWSVTAARPAGAPGREGGYQLCVGVLSASAPGELTRFLTWLGSRVVFLIDWNRARKRLRRFVRGRDAVELLDWAAGAEIGHRGFLQVGGDRMLNAAIELTKAPIRYGEPLHEVLGRARTLELLRYVLRTCTEGLLHGRSEFLLRDRIRTELSRSLSTARDAAQAVAVEHASLLVETGMALRDGLQRVRVGDTGFLQRSAARARQWEHRADDLVNESRTLARRWVSTEPLRDLVVAADNVADALEEAVSLLPLLQAGDPGQELLVALEELAELVLGGVKEYLKLVEAGRELHRESPRDDWEDFIQSVDGIVTIEHRADDRSRAAQALILTSATDFRQLAVCREICVRLEEAADALMRAAMGGREYVLGEAVPG